MNFNASMRAAAVGWLRYEKRCFLVAIERSPWPSNYRPDVIGINPQRKVIEVELKQSVADFKANAEKRHIIYRDRCGINLPSQFYFAVPRELVEKVKPMLPKDSGLITISLDRFGTFDTIDIVVPARSDSRAEKLSNYAIGRMISHQSGSLHRALAAVAKHYE